ncbi:DUF4239 domain-containing protein [Aureimonas fodinaquatilis]|uniref:bestrophin-like domain n=1 Tax=Aureimonas fodinaquatilis TaxID=2565783 RepID=UPI00165DA7A0|nr:DUF4239 domain-containing protein [Aureimonas fodinaquatilis]
MPPLATSLLIFACIFGSSVLAMAIGRKLKPHHISTESRDVVKLGIGMVSAMSALILSLIVSSVMSSYNQTERDVQQYAADIANLDASLRDHGPEADSIRATMRQFTQMAIEGAWPTLHAKDNQAGPTVVGHRLTAIGVSISDLSSATAEEQRTKLASLQAFNKVHQDYWKIAVETYSSVNPTLVTILTVWLTLIFVSFGLFAPRNLITYAFLFACSASIACAVYIILDLNAPFEGLMSIRSTPLENALSRLQQP